MSGWMKLRSCTVKAGRTVVEYKKYQYVMSLTEVGALEGFGTTEKEVWSYVYET